MVQEYLIAHHSDFQQHEHIQCNSPKNEMDYFAKKPYI